MGSDKSRFHRRSVCLFLFLAFLCSSLLAVPVDQPQAERAVRGWLRQNITPMGRLMSPVPIETDILTDRSGQTLCHIINLSPEGFVITASDDEIEPIIAFSSTGYYDGNPDSPLTTLLKKDMAGRLEAVRQKNRPAVQTHKKPQKWQRLFDAGEPKAAGETGTASMPSVDVVWVDPFLPTLWDQGDVAGSPCYNYYTPKNYVTGCVATAMAQVMRYYAYPTAGIGRLGFTIEVDGVSQIAYTRGGNGTGGAYNWAQMPYDPQSAVTTTQRAAIGALCYDAGVSVGMSFTSGASSASLFSADQRMTDTFYFGRSIYTQSLTSSGDDRLWNLLNANLDAQMPVILGISRTGGGHAVVADGYGYNEDTVYHHINMGWGGAHNAWYQLPTIDAYHTYTVIDDAIYNIYTSGGGEIISGRVTNLAGAPLSGVTVRAYTMGGALFKQTTTNSRGVYALKNLASGTQYRISASKSGESFLDQYVTTGTSSDGNIPGNRCGILFVSANAGPPTAFDIETDVDSTASVTIALQALDDGQPDPNLFEFHYIITSLPQHGDLSEPNVGPIDFVPYTLMADVSDVNYVPCPYFGGQDTFTYKANDGGTYPTGGDSNIATVTIHVNNQLYTDFGADSVSYSTLMMDTGNFYDVRSEVIYLQSDIGGPQKITDLALKIYIAPGRTLSNWTIRMRHTTLSYFNSVTTQFYPSGWTTVYQSNQSIPTGWVNFHFTTPFEYNGTQNLLVDFSFNNSGRTSPAGGYFIQNVGSDRVLTLASSTGTQGDPLTWDFWAMGGSYYLGSLVPSTKLIGEALVEPLAGDFDATCDVKLPDLAIFSQAWQTSSGDADYNPDCDLTAVKGAVDLQDLVILSDQWLATYR